MATACKLASQIEERLLDRNQVFERFFDREAPRLAEACREMSERFLRGARLLAFGRGPYATDAQHVSVEFVHPVIVGKRALPALDISVLFRPWLETILHPEDIVMGFGPPQGDGEVRTALAFARLGGALTFALPGSDDDDDDGDPGARHHAGHEAGDNAGHNYAVEAFTEDPFIHQE